MLNLFNFIIFFNDNEILEYLRKKGYRISRIPDKQQKYITKARNSRSNKIKKQIDDKFDEFLMLPPSERTATNLAKIANVNWRTAKKYLQLPEIKSKLTKKVIFS